VMSGHLGDSTFSTSRLADEVNLSRRQVERRVKALTKQTPTGLMQQMRLERAAQILKARPGSIAEVAYAVGFKSPSHFSVAFRKAYGHTPSEHITDAPGSFSQRDIRGPENDMPGSEQRLTPLR
jgi:transcriptional regulator GlxA family with amidase domain